MAVSAQLALSPVPIQGASPNTYDVDIGEPPEGAKMLALFGTRNGRVAGVDPATSGHTYGGLSIPLVASSPTSTTVRGSMFLLQDLAGKDGTTLSIAYPWDANYWTYWGALWVKSDAALEYVEQKTATGNTLASATHDPGAYGSYGTVGLYFNVKAFGSYATVGGTRPVSSIATGAWGVGSNNVLYHRLAGLSGATDSGVFTHTLNNQGQATIMSMLLGEAAGNTKRLRQAMMAGV